jgi:hypothetical protein
VPYIGKELSRIFDVFENIAAEHNVDAFLLDGPWRAYLQWEKVPQELV